MFKRDCDLSVTENTALGKALDCVGEDHNLVEQGTITVSLCIDIVSILTDDSEAGFWKIGKTQRWQPAADDVDRPVGPAVQHRHPRARPGDPGGFRHSRGSPGRAWG